MGDRLYRSRQDRMLAGVAGGLAEMWDADPSLVRIIWALLVIFTGGIALRRVHRDGDRRPRGGRTCATTATPATRPRRPGRR